ncbi:hypothetical protein MPTK1_1g22850 [Marchantia polymorpha subsp. ruderalis]|uniref:RRM domain-containing protein n=2 Tax=Marchantia polymorpha TaxID=3197 RepID=A0A176W8E9_MARPO|nr:hypothetical protein AXG93_2960s1000 [Marchantia polymorpha subsp. ruderalis]PTQ36296.1 hypothetical protein MARPO_0065s0092 [Marchantia polymorpha]BBM99662.1 hypothetical protein Mp_1g22850 [Marchantia polymorpha subsp. ruderalis]|eukprot:PTQ36296.1 hypothetical protein MARPO_0065s0092 [Marchantia polymorpha]
MGRERHRVFVKSGVTAETTEELLKRHFATFGTVTDVYIPRSMPGPTPKGFAYVSFESEDAVQRAVKEAVHEIDGRHYPVGRAEPRPSERNVWHHEDRKQLKTISEPLLPWPPRHARPVSPRGLLPGPIGLVPAGMELRSPLIHPSQVPLEAGILGEMSPFAQMPPFPFMDGYSMAGRPGVPAGLAMLRNDRGLPRSARVFVGGIPDVLVERHIRVHFQKYGNVEDVYFPREKHTGKRRGFCFVRFDSPRTAEVAAARSPRTIQGHEIGEIKVAQERPEDLMVHDEPIDVRLDVDRFHYGHESFRGLKAAPTLFGLPRGFDGRPSIRYRPY